MNTPLNILLDQHREHSDRMHAATEPAERLRIEVENSESIADALFDQIINPTDHDSQRLMGNELAQGMAAAGEHLSTGLAWAGFWIGAGAVIVAAIVKWGT